MRRCTLLHSIYAKGQGVAHVPNSRYVVYLLAADVSMREMRFVQLGSQLLAKAGLGVLCADSVLGGKTAQSGFCGKAHLISFRLSAVSMLLLMRD